MSEAIDGGSEKQEPVTEAAKFEVAEAKPEDGMAAFQDAEAALKSAEAALKDAERRRNDAEAEWKSAEAALKDAEAAVHDALAAFDAAKAALKGAEAKPKDAATEPKDAATEPKDAATEPKDIAGESKDAAGESEDAATEPKDAATESKDAAGESKDAATESKDAAGESKDAATEPKDAAGESKDAATESKGIAGGSKDAAGESKDAATESKGIAGESKDAAGESKDVAEEAKDAAEETKDAEAETKDAEPAQPAAVKEPDPPPAIESIEPAHGALAGGTAIVITGTGFAEGCEVTIGGAAATAKRESDTRLAVTTPAGAARGEVEVRIANPDGQSDAREGAFRFDPPPSLTGVEPAVVTVKGGTVVTLLGADFGEACAVLVDGGSVPASRAHQGRLEVVVSPHAAGTVDVAVRNPDGQRVTLTGALRYEEPPLIELVAPSRGLTTGGAEVVLTGRHFGAGCAVLFAGEPVEGVRHVSDTELRVSAPSHAAPEPVDVAVVNPSGISHRLPAAFTYERAAPKIASVSPAFGPNEGGTKLTITGTDFDAKCAVFVCGLPAKLTWKSRQEIEVVTPPVARDGLVDVRLVNEDDQASVAEKVFRYDAPLLPPVLTAINPTSGSQVGGTKVTLVGEDFAEGVKVRFAGIAAEARFVTRKQIEAVAPQYAGAGAVAIDVENPDGVVSTLENAFTYEARPAPSITSITPAIGPTTGGTKIVIEGVNFTPDCQVYIGREYPRDQAVKSATEIHAVVAPRKMSGVVDVEVAAPGLPKAVAKNGFRYDAVPAPVITSIAPNAGSVAGGTEMSITGKNFRKDSIVLIDGKQPKTVKFVDATTLEFKTPPGDPNKMVDVIVRNPDGNEALQKRAFLYDPRYR